MLQCVDTLLFFVAGSVSVKGSLFDGIRKGLPPSAWHSKGSPVCK